MLKTIRVKDPVLDKALAEIREAVNGLLRAENPTVAGVWELVERKRTSSATTRIVFGNLRGNSDEEYLLRCRINDQNSSVAGYTLQFNGADGTRYQRLSGDGTTVSATESTPLPIGRGAGNPGVVTIEGVLYARAGAIRVWRGESSLCETTTPDLRVEAWTGYWNNKTDEITSLAIVAPVTDGIGADSDFALYRRAA